VHLVLIADNEQALAAALQRRWNRTSSCSPGTSKAQDISYRVVQALP
jgi:hypothetical protein